MKKVLVCDPLAKEAIAILKDAGLEVDERSGLKEDDLVGCIGGYHGVIVRSATKITRRVIEAGKSLEVIARGGVGLDNIDTACAKERSIPVVNTPTASSVSVAELAIGLMFAVARGIAAADASIKAGKWEKKRFMGRELHGKTLGLIGSGRIGTELAKRAVALGMKVLIVRKTRKESPYGTLSTLDEMLPAADYISLHIPRTDETRNIINRETIAKMKDGVIIVNCARGGVVDEKALLEALKSGKVRGAGLDVFDQEPPGDNPLLAQENVVATPHIGASTKEGQFRVGTEIAQLVVDRLKA
ncbi:MAG: hydroxyacid dehydrogenase [bacterium]|nr:hydroxyacid dehydrogenase [bacterium]